METESFKLDVNVTAWSESPSSEFLSTVIISRNRAFEEFIIDENHDTVTSLGSYPDPSRPDPLIYLKFRNFEPNYVYELVKSQLHDRVLSELISHKIVQRCHSFDLTQEPLFVGVTVSLTQKVYNVVPCDLGKESQEESETCAICLENLLGSEDKPICKLPNCSHLFHEECVIEWLNRDHDSCPLCRQPTGNNQSEDCV